MNAGMDTGSEGNASRAGVAVVSSETLLSRFVDEPRSVLSARVSKSVVTL